MKKLFYIFLILAFISVPSMTNASLSESQINAITSLLNVFGATSNTISQVRDALSGNESSGQFDYELSIEFPPSNTTLEIGETFEFQWDTDNVPVNSFVNIDLFNSSSSYRVTQVKNTGSYIWPSVGSTFKARNVPVGIYSLRICATVGAFSACDTVGAMRVVEGQDSGTPPDNDTTITSNAWMNVQPATKTINSGERFATSIFASGDNGYIEVEIFCDSAIRLRTLEQQNGGCDDIFDYDVVENRTLGVGFAGNPTNTSTGSANIILAATYFDDDTNTTLTKQSVITVLPEVSVDDPSNPRISLNLHDPAIDSHEYAKFSLAFSDHTPSYFTLELVCGDTSGVRGILKGYGTQCGEVEKVNHSSSQARYDLSVQGINTTQTNSKIGVTARSYDEAGEQYAVDTIIVSVRASGPQTDVDLRVNGSNDSVSVMSNTRNTFEWDSVDAEYCKTATQPHSTQEWTNLNQLSFSGEMKILVQGDPGTQTEYIITCVSADGSLSSSDSVSVLFENTTEPSITVYGYKEDYAPGQILRVSWYTREIPRENPLDIYLSGSQGYTIANGVSNIGSYEWVIPSSIPGGAYTILVGSYAQKPLVEGESPSFNIVRPTALLVGDISQDGAITAYDASLISDHVGGATLDSHQQELADVNSDGRITMLDSRIILAHVVGHVSSLPDNALQYGDVNFDGSVTSYDAAVITDHLNGTQILGPRAQLVADVDDSGEINSIDAEKVFEFSLGFRSSLGVEPTVKTSQFATALRAAESAFKNIFRVLFGK